MSILDDAIREHLELKRAHGADAAELKKLEDEAFGPPARPDELDPLGEAPTEFMAAEVTEAKPEGEAEPSGPLVTNVADLQEAPAPPSEPPGDSEESAEPPDPEPAPAPEPQSSPSTEERHAIAEQPTELFDVEEAEPASGTGSPSDQELVDAEISEPRLAPAEPLAGLDTPAAEPEISDEPAAEEEEEDDFFSEQRLSDELSQALDAPLTDEHDVPIPQTDEQGVSHSEEHGDDVEEEDYEDEEYEEEEDPQQAEHRHEDVLEDTPDFLEDAPEDDDLWFEQRPPKDFDFDD